MNSEGDTGFCSSHARGCSGDTGFNKVQYLRAPRNDGG